MAIKLKQLTPKPDLRRKRSRERDQRLYAIVHEHDYVNKYD